MARSTPRLAAVALGALLGLGGAPTALATAPQATTADVVTAPFTLDHNRMLVRAEIRRPDGSWRSALLWVDTGNPTMMLSESLARDLGIDLSGATRTAEGGYLDVPPPAVRIGGMPLRTDSVTARVYLEPFRFFRTMPVEGNLPSTVLQRYHVVFDYPRRTLTLARPGSVRPRGERASASVNHTTGIVQIDAVVAGDTLSFALDNGASYSFVSGDVLARLRERHPDWPSATGAVGCANIWGWWPEEATWPLVRVPEIAWGPVRLTGVAIAGLPDFFRGLGLGGWYSQKTARPVVGFLGPNAFRHLRVEIDYANGAVYFARGAAPDVHDLDIVGLTVQVQADGRYLVAGVAPRDEGPSVPGVEPGDVLLEVGSLQVTGATMGTVVDALRGTPGDTRTLVLERAGRRFTVTASVERFL
jgi:hypothetical protein